MKRILIENEVIKIDADIKSVVGDKVEVIINRDNALYSFMCDIVMGIRFTELDGMVLSKVKHGGRFIH